MKIPNPEQFEALHADDCWLDIGAEICRRLGLQFSQLRRSKHGESVVLLIDNSFVLKIYKPSKKGFTREKTAIDLIAGHTKIPIPEIIAEGEFECFQYLVTTQIRGDLMTRQQWLGTDRREQLALLEQLVSGLRHLHSINADRVEFDWTAFIRHQAETTLERQRSEGGNPEWIESLPRYIEDNIGLVPTDGRTSFMHGDVHFGNIRVVNEIGRLRITGLFDFADSLKGFHEYEFIAIGVLMIQGQGDLQREFFRMYGYKDSDIDQTLRRRMMMLTILYEWSSLRRYAQRLRPAAINYSLSELERAIWSFA